LLARGIGWRQRNFSRDHHDGGVRDAARRIVRAKTENVLREDIVQMHNGWAAWLRSGRKCLPAAPAIRIKALIPKG
jgi:hypothetical protein